MINKLLMVLEPCNTYSSIHSLHFKSVENTGLIGYNCICLIASKPLLFIVVILILNRTALLEKIFNERVFE